MLHAPQSTQSAVPVAGSQQQDFLAAAVVSQHALVSLQQVFAPTSGYSGQ